MAGGTCHNPQARFGSGFAAGVAQKRSAVRLIDMANTTQNAQRLFSSRTFPIRYLVIPKCGCTFVKNLLWRLDNGSNNPDPKRIHDRDTNFARASDFGLTTEELRREEFNFVVLRNPVDRFLSLYFDKVVGAGYKHFVPLRKVLQENHGLNVAATTAAEHLANCKILIEWIDHNLQTVNELERDSHWTPQSYRFGLVKEFDLKLLLTSGLDAKLNLLLSGVVPNIEEALSSLERYSSGSGLTKDDILDKALRARINQVYRRDRDIYELTKDYWSKKSPATAQEIPRASDIFKG